MLRFKKYNLRLLSITAIYGGNASGKTNFFKAINFARKLIIDGTKPDVLIPLETFRLRAGNDVQLGSCFIFELLIDETIYENSFTVTDKEVLQEKLVHITSNNETVIYNRHNGKPHFDNSLRGNQFVQFVYEGTRNNQLLLTNAISQNIGAQKIKLKNIKGFRRVYDWFKYTLTLIAPDSRFDNVLYILDNKYPLSTNMNEILSQLDTVIVRLGGEKVRFKNIMLPDTIKFLIKESLKEGQSITLRIPLTNIPFVFTRKGGRIIVEKLVSYHSNADGTDVTFEIDQESDGTQRLIDLLPTLIILSQSNEKKVVIIDELDRSLHTFLLRALIESYLDSCSASTRSQLLLTTHDVLLMNQNLLRRDEMWVAERDANGATTLIAISDYKGIKTNINIRKSYLQGRLGIITHILLDTIGGI